MLREGPIPQAVQGLLEYLAGLFFIAAPFLFAYTDSGIATAASIVVGILFLVLAALSSGPTGLVKQLAPAVHALLDAVLAILLIAAPFVLGFSGVATPRNLFLISGVVWLLVTIGSRYGSKVRPTREPVPAAAPAAAARPSVPPPVESPSSDVPASDGGASARAPGPTGSTSTGPATGSVGPDYRPLDGAGSSDGSAGQP